jgi:hypothetical protein
LGLRDEHSIKRILVSARQTSPYGVIDRNRQHLKSFLLDVTAKICSKFESTRKLAKASIRRDLSDGRGADNHSVLCIRDCGSRTRAKSDIVRQPPQKSIRVEEKVHATSIPACQFFRRQRFEEVRAD